jgi:hypothetical protein
LTKFPLSKIRINNKDYEKIIMTMAKERWRS